MSDQKTDPKYDDSEVVRPKWVGRAIAIFMALIVLGVLNVGWLIMRPAPAEKAMQARVAADPQLLQAQKLVEASSCLSCHKSHSKAVGPSFADVAERYRSRDDAQAYLAERILNGSVGEWGKIVMPRQPQVKAQDAQLMANWVLSHRPEGAQP